IKNNRVMEILGAGMDNAAEFDPTGVFGKQLMGRKLKGMSFSEADEVMKEYIYQRTGGDAGGGVRLKHFFDPNISNTAYGDIMRASRTILRGKTANEWVLAFRTPAQQQAAQESLGRLAEQWGGKFDEVAPLAGDSGLTITPSRTDVMDRQITEGLERAGYLDDVERVPFGASDDGDLRQDPLSDGNVATSSGTRDKTQDALHKARETIRWWDSLTPETRQYLRSKLGPSETLGAPPVSAVNQAAVPAVERELGDIGLSMPDA